MNPFKKLLKPGPPKILELTFPTEFKTMRVASHRILKVRNRLFYRKDEVEKRMAEVIKVKIEKGELLLPPKNGKRKSNI